MQIQGHRETQAMDFSEKVPYIYSSKNVKHSEDL
jgi:hypothetical protein